MKVALTLLATISLLTTSLAQVPNYVPPDGLVSWWPFNGNATDESSNAFDGTVNNAILDTDRYDNPNSAYRFNGNNSSIVVGDPLNGEFDMLGGPLSISLWVSTSETALSSLVTKQNTAVPNSSGDYNLDMNALGEARMAMGFGDGQGAANVSSILVNDNDWHHIVGIYTPLSIELYVDGELVTAGNSSIAAPSPLLDSPQPLQFGTAVPNSTPLNGKLDDIGIWNRVLTPEEISALYNTSGLGVGAMESFKVVRVFPNPNHGLFTIDVELKELSTVVVYDQCGRTVHSEVFLANGARNIHVLDLSSLSAGTYVMIAKSHSGTATELLVIE